jgi:hypothetical protein
MGKKPVVAIIGLVWAGIALTGCGDCCKSCRNGNCAPPAVASRNTTTGGSAVPAPAMIGDARPAADSAPAAAPVTNSLATTPGIQPASGTTTPLPAAAPSTQSSLASPASAETTGLANNPVPPRMDDGLGAAPMPVSASTASTEARRVPPVPVMPKTPAAEPAAPQVPPRGTDSAPPAGQQLPSIGSASPVPAAPASSEALPPLPEPTGSALPPLPK